MNKQLEQSLLLDPFLDRSQDIQKIAKDVIEVKEVFLEVQGLVMNQGIIFDNIESNISDASNNVVLGKDQIVVAQTYQKSASSKICICGTILIIFALIVISIIIGIILTQNSQDNPNSKTNSGNN